LKKGIMEESRLQAAIVDAFADTVYPGDDRLTVHNASGRAFDETFQLLRGKSWQECPVVEFMQGDTPIPDLTPEAFQYYMPALLLASLDNGDIACSLAFYLSPTSARNTTCEFPYDDTENYHRRMMLFTERQRTAIIRVLDEHVARGWEERCDVADTIRLLSHP
jgi:hypothetical protein